MPIRLLVIDAYDTAGRNSLDDVGATRAGQLYARALHAEQPRALVEVIESTGIGPVLSKGTNLDDYDGLVWTGSNLTIHKPDTAVDCQIELARTAYRAGIPQFGSCWAIQLATVAAGGSCGPNPRGREFGIARQVKLTAAGQSHPLVRGRTTPFEALISHEDMVVSLPDAAQHLAQNEFTEIQALAVQHDHGTFWAVQYHPEYDLFEVARLAELRKKELIQQQRFADEQELREFVNDYQLLHQNPAHQALAQRHRVAADLLDPTSRRLELRNWLDVEVIKGRR